MIDYGYPEPEAGEIEAIEAEDRRRAARIAGGRA